MFARLLDFLLLHLALVQCISGRLSPIPKFYYGQDSTIIVNTEKPNPKLIPKLQNALYYNIPVYKVISPISGVPRATAISTTPAPSLVDEYPRDLLYIARNKLGVKRLDQLPSIGELGKMLGTGNAFETIKYVRTLTSSDQGIFLMKTYLESLDYDLANSREEATRNSLPEQKDNDEDNITNNSDIDADYYDTSVKINEPTTTKKTIISPHLDWGEERSLIQRPNDFEKQYSVAGWSENSTAPKSMLGKLVLVAHSQAAHQQGAVSVLPPVLVRKPLPYHYPIPLRPALGPQAAKPMPRQIIVPTVNPSRPTKRPMQTQLNIPKEPSTTSSATHQRVAPHIQQLAQMASISPEVLNDSLQQQPKLAELAKRISRLPLVHQHSQAIDSQLFMAVKRALSQDESLKRLLGATQTLK
ncbi:GH23158 [Drosophila grimshawi]|uniref:GH23158 n=2 Tax=Drosophila grimshawi TaxID=7222 RepID=B4JVP3_DROGR|nr:GH23158 [Drosophila grimshawi]